MIVVMESPQVMFGSIHLMMVFGCKSAKTSTEKRQMILLEALSH